jgi:hypothetical protein
MKKQVQKISGKYLYSFPLKIGKFPWNTGILPIFRNPLALKVLIILSLLHLRWLDVELFIFLYLLIWRWPIMNLYSWEWISYLIMKANLSSTLIASPAWDYCTLQLTGCMVSLITCKVVWSFLILCHLNDCSLLTKLTSKSRFCGVSIPLVSIPLANRSRLVRSCLAVAKL